VISCARFAKNGAPPKKVGDRPSFSPARESLIVAQRTSKSTEAATCGPIQLDQSLGPERSLRPPSGTAVAATGRRWSRPARPRTDTRFLGLLLFETITPNLIVNWLQKRTSKETYGIDLFLKKVTHISDDLIRPYLQLTHVSLSSRIWSR